MGDRSSKGILISAVKANSIAADLGITSGDYLLTVDGRQPRDLIDYRYLIAGETVNIHIRTGTGREYLYDIEKEYDEDPGLIFNPKCFGEVKRCRNHCLFCFVDQMPKGMRPSLYIKDDDYRLSFLDGSFITMTNLDADDLRRIIELRLSPLYISVHTTNSQLRRRLMGNERACAIKEQLRRLAEAGIEFHAQVVLMPGINDGFYLEETISDLIEFWPQACSLALVPVGLTKHRNGLYPLQGYGREGAQRIIHWGQGWQRMLRRRFGSTFLYMADEFYVLAGEPIPARKDYDDFPQLENGIGLLRLFYDDMEALDLPPALKKPARITLATGISAAGAVTELAARLRQVKGLDVQVEMVPNRFFGPNVSVAGLITGSDLLQQLQGKDLGDTLFLPGVLLRKGTDVFLDNINMQEVSCRLEIDIEVVNSPADLARRLTGGVKDDETGGCHSWAAQRGQIESL